MYIIRLMFSNVCLYFSVVVRRNRKVGGFARRKRA